MNQPFIISNVKVFASDGVHDNVHVLVNDGKIIAIENTLPPQSDTAILSFPKGAALIPGMIDLHVHGAAGVDVMDGSVAALATLSQALLKEGVTGFLATTMTESIDRIEAALCAVKAYRAQNNPMGAELLGIHLEGPFLSPHFPGAQQASFIIPPDIPLFERWQALSGHAIKRVTLAPEALHALEFIRYLTEQGVCVSIGHSNADFAQVIAAIDAGASQATHLFNAMRPLHHREPGCAGALLLDSRIKAELIADGIHLHPQIVKLAVKVKGIDNIILVTDAMRAKCMGDGCFDLGGQTVFVAKGKAYLGDGTLAGSVLQLNQALANFVNFTNCDLAAGIQLISENPARELKLFPEKGAVRLGEKANFVILGPQYKVLLVVYGKQVIYNDI